VLHGDAGGGVERGRGIGHHAEMKDVPEHRSLPLPVWFVAFARGYGLEPAALAERVLRKFVETPRTQICVGFRPGGGGGPGERGGPKKSGGDGGGKNRRGDAERRRPLTSPKLGRGAR